MSTVQRVQSFFFGLGRFFKRHWKLLLIVAILLGVGGFIQWRRVQKQNKPLNSVKPTWMKLTQTLNVSGVIDAKEKATLRFASGGKLTALSAHEGDAVKKGQTVAKIDIRETQKKLQQDLNSYFNERMDFDQGLADRQNIAPTDTLGRTAQKEQKDLENTVLSVEIRTIAIQNSALQSPFDGILVSSPANAVGSNLLSTDAFTIVNPDSLVFRATVDQADIAKVKKGQSTVITLDAWPDEELKATVNYVAFTSSQTSTGTVYVIEVPLAQSYMTQYETSSYANLLEKFRLGMNGDAKIILAEKERALAVPLSATRERDGKTFVDIKTGPQTKQEREIKPGLQTDEDLEVLGGLTENDDVVIP